MSQNYQFQPYGQQQYQYQSQPPPAPYQQPYQGYPPQPYQPNYQQQPYQQQYQQPPAPYYPPPTSTEPLTTAEGEKFSQKSAYNDVWAALLFVAVLLGFGVCAYFGVSVAKTQLDGSTKSSIALNSLQIVGLVGVSVGGGFVFSILYFLLMKKFAGPLIKVQCVLFILAMLGYAAYCFLAGVWIAGIILAIITLIMAYVLWCWRSRIPFAKIMLKTVTGIISLYPSTIFVGVIGLVLQTAFAALFFFTVFGWIVRFQESGTTDSRGNTTYNGSFYALYVFLLFSFYWTTQVIKTTVHVIVSGVFATYYFSSLQNVDGSVSVQAKNPTSASTKRALTTSFGSICYGSMIIALLQTIRALLRMAANQAAGDGNLVGYFCAICAECFLSFIEGLVQYFNMYAYTQVAIYGKDYCSAAKATWNLVKRKGVDAIINDNLVGIVITMGALFIGLLTGAVTYVYYIFSGAPSSAPGYAVVVILLAIVIGSSEFLILGEVIESGTATTFVCMAEDPECLRRTKPELFEKIRAVYPEVQFY